MAKIVSDPELLAMQEIGETMGNLSAPQRRRVREWLIDRYGDEDVPFGGPMPQLDKGGGAPAGCKALPFSGGGARHTAMEDDPRDQ